jgi:hypothetical protein
MKKELTDEQFNVQYVRAFKEKPDVADLILYLGYPPISSTIAGISVFHDGDTYYSDELIDALWNAVIKRNACKINRCIDIGDNHA